MTSESRHQRRFVMRHAIRVVLAIALATGALAASAFAQPLDKRTFFTFSGPVSIPGVTLPAGKYLFRVVDPTVTGRVVQVMSDDGKKAYAMFFTLPAQRLEPADNPEVRFMETASTMPPAVKTWWYPGQRTGWEMIYPKEQARLLAEGVAEPILTTRAETVKPAETRAGDLERLGRGQETPVAREATPAPVAPTGVVQPGELAAPEMPIMEMLPQTGSSLPLVGLIGLLCLAGAASLRFFRTAR